MNKCSIKDDIGVANRNVKRRSSPVLVKEIQIKNYNEMLLIGVEYNTLWLDYKMVLLFWKIIWHFFSFCKSYLFSFGCAGSSLLLRFCLLGARGCYSDCRAPAPHCSCFSCCGHGLEGTRASGAVTPGSRAQAQ